MPDTLNKEISSGLPAFWGKAGITDLKSGLEKGANAIHELKGLGTGIVDQLLTGVPKAIDKAVKPGYDYLSDSAPEFLVALGMDEAVADKMKTALFTNGPANPATGGMISFLMYFGTLLKAGFAYLDACSPFLQQSVNKTFRPNLVSLNTEIEALLADDKTEFPSLVRGEQGYSANELQTLKKAMSRQFTPQEIFGMFHNGGFTKDDVYKRMKRLGYFDEFIIDNLLEMSARLMDVGTVQELQRRGKLQYIDAQDVFGRLGFDEKTSAMLENLKEKLTSANESLEHFQHGFVSEQSLNERLRKLGYNSEDASNIIKAQYRPLEPGMAIRALRQGLLSREALDKELLESAIDKDTGAKLLTLSEERLELPAVIALSDKGVFDGKTVAKFKLDSDKPPVWDKEVKRLGIADDSKDLFWRGHWKLPGVNEAFQLFNRGEIDPDSLERCLIGAGYSPYWRDKMLSFRFEPLPRLILGGLFDIGKITKPQLVKRLQVLGYSPADALAVADLIETQKTDKPRELAQSDILSAYIEGAMSDADALANLIALKYTVTDAAFLMTRARGTRALKEQAKQQAALVSQVESAQKQMTSAALQAYSEGLTNVEDTRNTLVGLGYTPEVASFTIRHTDLQNQITEAKTQRERIKTRFQVGDFDSTAATKALVASGFDAERVSQTLVAWNLEGQAQKAVTGHTDKLPARTDLTRWLKLGIISADDFAAGMSKLDYTEQTTLNYLTEIMLGLQGKESKTEE